MDSTNQILASKQTSAFQWTDSLWVRILLITAFGLGVFFRFAGLGNKIYSHDEAYASLRAAGYQKSDVLATIRDGEDHSINDIQKLLTPGIDKNITDTLFITASSGPHQAPLFYLLAHYWMRLVGFTPAAMRGLAAVLGLLSIPAMYWLGWELFRSSPLALLSSALFALSPFHILFAQDARPYSLWTLATLLSGAALLRAMRKNDRSTWLMYSMTLLLGMYSHQLFILVALVHGFYFAGLFLLQHKRDYLGFLSACLLAFIGYLPWLFTVITYWDRAVQSMDWVTRQTPWQRYIQAWALIFSSPFMDFDFASGNLIPYLLRALMLILIAYGFVWLILRGSLQAKMFLLPMFMIPAGALIAPDLLLGGMRSTGGRYFVPVNIATILVVAYFLINRLDQARPTAYGSWNLLVGLVMAASLFSNLNSLQAETWWNKELGRVRPDFVDEIDKDQTLLIVSSGTHGTTIGDVLLLSFEVDSNVHIRLPEDLEDIKSTSKYDYLYWFPGSDQEVQETSQREGLQVREILPGTLWQIEGMLK